MNNSMEHTIIIKHHKGFSYIIDSHFAEGPDWKARVYSIKEQDDGEDQGEIVILQDHISEVIGALIAIERMANSSDKRSQQ